MAKYVEIGMFNGLWIHKFITIYWIAVVLLHNVVVAELGPSEENIRQYLALYKEHNSLPRLKPYDINNLLRVPYQNGIGPRENLNTDERMREFYKTRENWPSRDYYRPRTVPDWHRNGVSEIKHDDDVVEKQYVERLNAGPRDTSVLSDISRNDPKSSTGYVYDENMSEPIKEEKKSPQQSVGEYNAGILPMAQTAFETESKNPNPLADIYFVVIVAGCSAAAIFGVVAAGFCFYRVQKNSKAAAEVDYPAYGVTGPSKEHQTSPSGDRRLAQSAQMYHYQHQKQQMIAVEKATTVRNTSASDVDSEEENEEGDYTVYECPGLASTGEMEVKNPLFHDDSTPVSPPMTVKETVQKP